MIPNVTAVMPKSTIQETVANKGKRMTDGISNYRGTGAEFAEGHAEVTHSAKENVLDDANTAEGVLAISKRGIYGVYHSASKRHLHRYFAEFDFRYNTREMHDRERVQRAIGSAVGKRLMHREPGAQTAVAP